MNKDGAGPYRPATEDITYQQSQEDPIEYEARMAIRILVKEFEVWRIKHGCGGRELGQASEGVGQGVAAIIDSVDRLRKTKLGT